MKKLCLTSVAIVCCTLFTSNVAAQSDKVSIPSMPQPNQATRLILTEEVNDELYPDTLGVTLTKPKKVILKAITEFVLKSGPVDDQGRFEVEITCEDSSGELTLDGASLPFDDDMKKSIGKKFTITFNREGKVFDVKGASDVAGLTKYFSRIRELIYDNIPKGELSIGETSVFSVNMAAPEIFEKGTFKYRGDMKSKLVAVVNDAGYRIAKFDQTFEAKLTPTETNSQSETGGVSEDLKISGNGTLEINLDKSLLKAYQMKMIFSRTHGAVSATNPQTPIRTSKMTLNVSVSVKN
jgi:hypothetical protein